MNYFANLSFVSELHAIIRLQNNKKRGGFKL
jgi:hypothetical protein